MHPTNCLNCGVTLTDDDKFCPNCGQKSDTHRVTLGYIFHEFFHSFTHADKGFLGLLADLAIKPGIVAREYIAGKRKKYFNPFTFFVLVMGLFVLANNVFHFGGEAPKADPNIVRRIPTEEARKLYLTRVERSATASHFTQKNGNIIAMIALPFFTLMTWLFYRKRGYNYAEILVGNMLFLAFANLLFTVFVSTWIGRTAGTSLYFVGLAAGFIIQVLYVGWAQYQFFGFKSRTSILLTWLTSLVTVILWAIITTAAYILYIFRSDSLPMVKQMWERITGS